MAVGRLPFVVALIFFGLLPVQVDSLKLAHKVRANPIRKVVNMLKNMEKKVKEEGEKSSKIFNKYMCYCKTTRAQLRSQITAAEEKIPQVQSKLEEAGGILAQLQSTLEEAKSDRVAARDAVQTATELRHKGAATFAAEHAEMTANLDAMGGAIAAITKGMGGFLQTTKGALLQKLVIKLDMASADRDMLSSFLATGERDNDEAPQSNEINGILKQLAETMAADLAEMINTEKMDINNFKDLSVAKKNEIAALTKDIELKTGRLGDVRVEIASLNSDLEDTQEAMAEDKEFDENMATTCANKKAKYGVYTKNLSLELVALAETIKLLNDDNALDLFKKSLPGASLAQGRSADQQGLSFLQMDDSSSAEEQKRQQASNALQTGRQGDPRISALELSLRGGKGFAPVKEKIDKLIGILGQEQGEDDDKIVYCRDEIDRTEDEMKQAMRGAADRQTIVSEAEGMLSTLVAEIQSLIDGIKSLDEEVAAQTALRKEKAAQVNEILSSDNAAKSLIEVASKRLKDFYHKVDLAQIGQFAHMGMGAGKGAAEAGSAVIQMLDEMRNDLSASIAGLTAQDAQAQKDYEHFLDDSASKRRIDTQAIADKESDKADSEIRLHKERSALKIENLNVEETKKELAALHNDCDWLASNYDLRKSARVDEVDALKNAKAVLSGADFSM